MSSKKFLPGVFALLVLAVALAALVLIGLPRTKESRATLAAADPQSSAGAGVLPEAAPAAAGLGGASPVSAGSTSTGGIGPAPAAAGVAAPRADLSSKKGAKLPGRQTGPDYARQDAGMPRNFVLALDEIWVTDAEGKGRVVAVEAASAEELEQLVLAPSAAGESAQAILYEDGATRNEFTRRIVSSLVTVRLDEGSDPAEVARLGGAASFELPEYAPGFAVLQTGGGLASLRTADLLTGRPGVLLAEAQLARQHAKRAMPNDALINQQWHLKFNNQAGALAGTDLNIESVWAYPTAGAGRRGRGVRIGIVDDGVQTSHPDFAGNIDTANDYDWNDSTPNDPNPGTGDDHGTACAGDAAARGNNGIGVSGSAPEATIVGMRLIAGFVEDRDEAEAMNYLPQLIQIKSNSWGPSDTGSVLEGPGPLTKAALQSSAETGRGGKGTIFMWAGGNGLEVNDNSNYDGYANSIYTIAVGAFDSRSRQAYYSEPGANLVITAPSSGASPALGKTTTDRTGSAGYVAGDYDSEFGGTSSSTPTAAGVVALMLEANPNLGWRDVQEILLRSAKKVNPSDVDWKTPVAPDNINHNHKFGGGLIDAAAAVGLATAWTNLGEQVKRTSSQTGLSVPLPDNNASGITRQFTVAPSENLRVEHVTVRVSITHARRRNLRIELTSPAGTTSVLATEDPAKTSGSNFSNWTFMTVRNWGENAAGTWTLRVADRASGTSGTLTAATLEVFGASTAPVNPPPSVVLTSPVADLAVSPGAVVDLAATATDSAADGSAGSVASVEFLANGTVIRTDNAAPYAFQWIPAIGTYTVAARATDNEGATSTSSTVTVEVRNQTPTVTAAQISPSVDAYSDEPLQVSGVLSNDPEGDPVTLSYQWQSSLNGTVWTDAGGTASALAAAQANAGKLWRCAVRASDGNSTGEPFFTAPVSVGNRPVTAGMLGSAYSFQSAIYVPAVSTTFTRPVIINEFSQGSNGGEWIELLVLQDTSLAYYDIEDASGNYLLFQDDPVWDSIPAGTIVVIYNGASKDPLLPAEDTNPLDDSRMVLSSRNAAYFDQTTAWPALGNSGDAIFVNDADNITVAQLAYGSSLAATPNVGTVNSGRAAYYTGDTEEGITSGGNWRTTSSATARSARSTRALGDLFFSEYVEGTSNNKALEIYNPSASAVNLGTAGYRVEMYFNGATSTGTAIALTGTVAAGGVHVLTPTNAPPALLALANQSNGSSWFNGNDAVVLRKGGTGGEIVDVIGQIGVDPGTAWTATGISTADRTLRRKTSVVQGDTNATNAFDPSIEWDGFPIDTFSGLGSHATSSGPALAVSASPASFAENAGTNASTGTVTIPAVVATNVPVTLSSGNTNAATVPPSVTINAGSTNATFPIAAVDNLVSDGSKVVAISASASGYASAQVQVTVTDNEVSLEGVTPGTGNNPVNAAFVANLRAGTFGQGNLYRTGAGHEMPPGLTLESATGLLSGTPAQAGTYNIVLEVYNSLGQTGTQTFTLVVSGGASPSFTDWVADYPAIADPAPGADPDGDGLPNLVEYFMGLSPVDAVVSGDAMVLDTAEAGEVRMDYRRSKSLNGVSGGVAWRNDLADGVWSSDGVVETLVSDHGTYEVRRATVPLLPGESRKFLRLEVEQQ
jgi:subtilisin-like proprotein convertase family protein